MDRKRRPDLIKTVMERVDWLKAAHYDSQSVLEALDRFSAEPYAQEIVELALSRNPMLAFQQADQLSRFDWWPSLLEQAASTAAQVEPALIFSFFPLLADQPYATKILQQAEVGCVDRGMVMALEHAKVYLNRPEATKILRHSAERFPTQAIYFFQNYQTHPQALALLRAAAQAEPTSALVHANKFSHLPEAKGILQQAMEADPYGAARFKERYEQFLK